LVPSEWYITVQQSMYGSSINLRQTSEMPNYDHIIRV
jgi:hypothetical protein